MLGKDDRQAVPTEQQQNETDWPECGGQQNETDWPECRVCGDEYPPARAALGYRICLWCGEEAAQAERHQWTVTQEYGKGNYQFIPARAALQTLRETNQKAPR